MFRNLVFFDTETTNKSNGRLIQLAFGFNVPGGPVREMMFKPAEPICIEAMEIHHICERAVKELDPVDPAKLQPVFNGRTAVAHNAPFDIAVMAREGVNVEEYIDTLKVAQHLFPELPAHRLQYLRYALDLPTSEESTAHDAKGDVEVLIELFNHLKKKIMADMQVNEEDAIEEMVKLTSKKVLMKKLPFGKYKDRLFSELVKTADGRQYLSWLRGQSDLGDDLKETLDFYLKN